MSIMSKLDHEQVIKSVYDETTQSLRTTSSGSAGDPPTGTIQQEQLDQATITNIKLDQIDSDIVSGNSTLTGIKTDTTTISTQVTSINTKSDPLVITDKTSLINTASTPVPAFGTGYLELFVTTSKHAYKVQTIEDIGEFFYLAIGVSGSEQLICHLPLGGGEAQVDIPAGSRITLGTFKTSNVNIGNIAIQLIGRP